MHYEAMQTEKKIGIKHGRFNCDICRNGPKKDKPIQIIGDPKITALKYQKSINSKKDIYGIFYSNDKNEKNLKRLDCKK